MNLPGKLLLPPLLAQAFYSDSAERRPNEFAVAFLKLS
jgi:hypothetical protein